jgi:protein SCO1/2
MTSRVVAILVCLLLATAAHAEQTLLDLAFQQHPGAPVPMDAPLQDETGHTIRLRDAMAGRPAILVIGYLHCPNLCGLVRDDMFHALSQSGLRPNQYSLLVVSIDPAETTADAAAARREDLARYPLPGPGAEWHYLTGPAASPRQIAKAVGFPYRYDPVLKQFMHPAGLVFLNTAGLVSGYLLGVGYTPGDLALGITRAGQGSIEQAAAPILLLCFHFDPTTGRYTLAITKVLQLAGLVTVLTLCVVLGLAFRRERTR